MFARDGEEEWGRGVDEKRRDNWSVQAGGGEGRVQMGVEQLSFSAGPCCSASR